MTFKTYNPKPILIIAIIISCIISLETSNLIAQQATWQSEFVFYDQDNKLGYKLDSLGNGIPDFSHVGYNYGDTSIPEVEVVAELFASNTDAKRIQQVIDSVGSLPVNQQGFRGAILLHQGLYLVEDSLVIDESGIVLRGVSDAKNGTVIRATGNKKRPLIHLKGEGEREIIKETAQLITEEYVPVGQQFVVVEHGALFNPGEEIVIYRKGNAQWIKDINMDTIPPRPDDRPVFAWDPESYALSFERVISRVNSDTLFFRNPIVMALDKRHDTTWVYKTEYPGRISNVGVEYLRLESEYQHEIDEKHGWDAIFIDGVSHSWVQFITAQYFGYSAVSIEKNSKHITVQYARNITPKSKITGGRRYSFNIDGELNLVKHCETLGGRHDVVTGARVSGPNVFFDCTIKNAHNDAGPHHRWATGTLYDNIQTDGQLNVQNRGNRGSGHGWAGVNHVVWNSISRSSVIQSPIASGKNYAIGLQTEKVEGFSPNSPDGIWEGHNKVGLFPNSLYLAQLNERHRVSRETIQGLIVDRERPELIKNANHFLGLPPKTITAYQSVRSSGGLHDYYSEGTYWWPNPNDPEGAYIRRDGETNPNNFDYHRIVLENFSYQVGVLLSAYLITEDARYLNKVINHLEAWFVHKETKMNPHLLYAQAIQGISKGRGIGIIDTGHLVDVARVVEILSDNHLVPLNRLEPVISWFRDYLGWLTTHPNGIEEMNWRNNHGTWWHVQAAAFARVTNNAAILEDIRNRLEQVLVPNQISKKGEYIFEVSRTKPYAYSQYNLEAFVLLSLLLSNEQESIFPVKKERALLLRSIQFLKPFLIDKELWPYEADVSEWASQPNRFLFFPLLSYYEQDINWLNSWKQKGWPELSTEDKRNLSAKNILLWLPLLQQYPNEQLGSISEKSESALHLSERDPVPSIYHNPILPGFNPDPSITKKDSTYYLTTSTFEYFPGLPIYKSNDLVNWSLVGHAIHRTEQLSYGDVTNSRGIFAPSFKYHDGTFYIATRLIGTPQKKGSFILTAKKPEGPWSDPIWLDEAGGIDPSLFFDDDGSLYLLGNLRPENAKWNKQRIIWLREFDLDKKEFIGEQHTLIDAGDYYQNGTLDGGYARGVNNFEGPHLYKKNGYYYLLIAHGGTEEYHAVSIFRSKSITGPYESNPENPMLTHRDLDFSHPITSTGHASLIQDHLDQWWTVYHGKRPYGLIEDPYYGSGLVQSYPLGRETMLSPVDWSSDWPIVNPTGAVGRAELTHRLIDGKTNSGTTRFTDYFTRTTLNTRWNFIRIPKYKWYEIDSEKEQLLIQIRPETLQEPVNPSFIGVRMEQVDFTFTTNIDFQPKVEGEEAGIVALREQYRHITFSVKQVSGEPHLVIAQQFDEQSPVQVLYQTKMNLSNLSLKMSSEMGKYRFYYRIPTAENWFELPITVDGTFLGMDLGGGRFTGSYVGLYGTSNGNKSNSLLKVNWADFEFNQPRFEN